MECPSRIATTLKQTLATMRPKLNKLHQFRGEVKVLCSKGGITWSLLSAATRLSWNSSGLTTADLNVLGRVLQTRALGSLCSLDLAGNRISDEGISAFSTAISSGSLAKLTKLDLAFNKIGDDGMKAFSDAIAMGSMGSLQALYVDDSIYHPALKVVCEARGIDL